MRLNKAQTTVIVLLNVVIAALLCTIFLVPILSANASGGGTNDDPDKPVITDPTTPTHSKLRDAADGKVAEIARETRLMGSGDESVVATFYADGVTYIFGNATVGDLDFDGYGGFLCRIGERGNILGFEYYDGTITACARAGAGYAVAVGSGSGADAEYSLYVTTGDDAEKAATLDGVGCGIFAADGTKTAVVTQPTATSLKLTEYSVAAGGEWNVGRSTRIDSGYTLKFFDCYDFSGAYVISARAHSLPRYDSLVLYSFTPGGDAAAHYYGGWSGNITRPYAVMPSDFGYFALCDKNGIATVISVDYAFESFHSLSLGFTFDDAKLAYSRGKYYATFDCADGAVTYELDKDLGRRKLSELDGLSADRVAAVADGSVAVGAAGAVVSLGTQKYTELKIVSLSGGKAVTVPVDNAVVYGMHKSPDGGYNIVLSASGGDGLSKPTGGRDVYIVKVNL